MVQDPYPCEHVVPIEQEPRHRLVIANDFIRAFVIEILPGDRTLCHRHEHDYLMYVIGDGEIVSAPRYGEPGKLTYRNGDCELSSAGLVHVVNNVGTTPFRNVLVELLPAVGELQRGAEPRVIGGDVTVKAIFKGELACVLSLEMHPDGQVETLGEAIFVTLLVDGVRDISWILGRAVLGCDSDRPLRAILFQLGRTH